MNKLTRSSGNIAEIVIIVLILVLANWLSYKFFARLDVTENKMYTISQATKDVLGGLDDPVNVDFYLSRDLPPQLVSVRDEVRDKLAEYTAYSKGRFKVKYIDPQDDETIKEKAANSGVQEFQLQVLEKDQYQVKKVFFGLVMSFEDKSEAIPMAVEPASLEYELTSRLVKLTLDKKPKIGFFEGTFRTSEQQQGPSYQRLREILSGQQGMFEFVQLDPQSDRVLPDDLDGVIVCGAFGMPDSLKYSIDQFLLKGGQVLVAIDPMMQAGQAGGLQQAFPSLPTYEDELKFYGVEFDKKLIVDPACANAQFQAGFMQIIQPYYLWPKVGPEGFNQEISAVSKLESLVLPWTCPLKKVEVEGVTWKPLASSSAQAFLMSSPFELKPEQDWRFLSTSSESQGPYAMACLVEGKIPTAYPGGPPSSPPPPPPVEGEEPPADLAPDFNAAEQVKVGEGKGRLIVMSSATAISDNFMQQFNENALFVANVMDMLLMGDELLDIRSTPVTNRPLKQLSDGAKSALRWGNILAVPVLLVAFGLLLWFLKGRRRRAIQAQYSREN